MVVNYPWMSSVNFGVPDFCFLLTEPWHLPVPHSPVLRVRVLTWPRLTAPRRPSNPRHPAPSWQSFPVSPNYIIPANPFQTLGFGRLHLNGQTLVLVHLQ